MRASHLKSSGRNHPNRFEICYIESKISEKQNNNEGTYKERGRYAFAQ